MILWKNVMREQIIVMIEDGLVLSVLGARNLKNVEYLTQVPLVIQVKKSVSKRLIIVEIHQHHVLLV
jgi:hypothetical protein